MDEKDFIELQSQLSSFKEVLVQLEYSTKTDNIAMGYLSKGFDRMHQAIDALQKDNEELKEKVYVLEKENQALQDINNYLQNVIKEVQGICVKSGVDGAKR